jgi:hypothetical protein
MMNSEEVIWVVSIPCLLPFSLSPTTCGLMLLPVFDAALSVYGLNNAFSLWHTKPD